MSDFDLWNKLKKKLENDKTSLKIFPREGEVWMSNIGRNIGQEQNGSNETFSRPVLVVRKFNNKIFWCIPLSTKQKSLDFYFNYIDSSNRRVAVILAQMRLLSIKRLQRKMYDLDQIRLSEIKNRLKEFL